MSATEVQTAVKVDSTDPAHKKSKSSHPVVSKEAWLQARRDILVEEKRLSRELLALASKRQQMPWEAVTEDYIFIDPQGKAIKFADLFSSHSSLVVYHLMFDEDWDKGCGICSAWLDGLNGTFPHIKQRADLVIVAKADHVKLDLFVKSKGWSIPTFSSLNSNFNKDYGVEFSEEDIKNKVKGYNFGSSSFTYCKQAPGASVFHKNDEGKIFRTYATFGPGMCSLSAMFGVIDMIPEGRDEKGKPPMWWIKHKESYTNLA